MCGRVCVCVCVCVCLLQVAVAGDSEMTMAELTSFLDALDWAGFYAADCFKFLDRAFDAPVTFDDFRRWQEFAWENRANRRGPTKRDLLEAYREQYVNE